MLNSSDDAEMLAQLRGAVRRFVREQLVPLEAQVAREETVPADIVHPTFDHRPANDA